MLPQAEVTRERKIPRKAVGGEGGGGGTLQTIWLRCATRHSKIYPFLSHNINTRFVILDRKARHTHFQNKIC